MKYILSILLFAGLNLSGFSQDFTKTDKAIIIDKLIDSLWVNPSSFFNKDDKNWRKLCDNLHLINTEKLNEITDKIFNAKNSKIKNNSSSSSGLIGLLNNCSRKRKLNVFNKKINSDFCDRHVHPQNRTVLVEGDSWFEYPVFIKDITDNLIENDNFAIYSLASGGDWASNIISSGEYKDKYVKFKPDVFLISGGGNDMLENKRLTNFISNTPIDTGDFFLKDYRDYVILRENGKAVPLCTSDYCPPVYRELGDSIALFSKYVDNRKIDKIVNGRRYLNKNFYRFLVTTKLEYKILFESIKKIDPQHFDSIRIITQGYDNAIPSSKRKLGIRLFMKNGQWLKKPLESKRIFDNYTQESIVMAIIFDFNEMLIELGKEYDNIYHIDIRGFTRYLEKYYNKKPGSFWYNELHPTNIVFKEISNIYAELINKKTLGKNKVIRAIDFFEKYN